MSDAIGRIERILVVTAHPDDVDFGAAGTIARWTQCGIEVAYCIVTDGDAGGFDPAVARTEIGTIRRAEQTAAAKEVGVERLSFLGYPDGRLEPTIALRRDLTAEIRRFRPDRVLLPNPERNWSSLYASHPDHMACGQAAMAAVYPDARNPFAFPDLEDEGLRAHAVSEIWLMSRPDFNRVSDISTTFDAKLSALRRHVSQHQDPDGLEQRLRGWNAANAKTGGLDEGCLAELFTAIDSR